MIWFEACIRGGTDGVAALCGGAGGGGGYRAGEGVMVEKGRTTGTGYERVVLQVQLR